MDLTRYCLGTSSKYEIAVTATSESGACKGPTHCCWATSPVTLLSTLFVRNLLLQTVKCLKTRFKASHKNKLGGKFNGFRSTGSRVNLNSCKKCIQDEVLLKWKNIFYTYSEWNRNLFHIIPFSELYQGPILDLNLLGTLHQGFCVATKIFHNSHHLRLKLPDIEEIKQWIK